MLTSKDAFNIFIKSEDMLYFQDISHFFAPFSSSFPFSSSRRILSRLDNNIAKGLKYDKNKREKKNNVNNYRMS